jgi:hypothetical protein
MRTAFNWRNICLLPLLFPLSQAPDVCAAPAPMATQTPGIKLDSRWKSIIHPAGTASAMEIGALVSGFASASENLNQAPEVELYRSINYLATMKSIEPQLKQIVLKTGIAPKPLNTPGFPSYSLKIYSFDPKDPKAGFDGYDRMHIIADKMDQVVAVELTTEIPSKCHHLPLREKWYRTWDFANNMTKAMSSAAVEHEKSKSANLIVIVSSFIKPDDRTHTYPDTPIKESRLFLPVPLAEIILTCVQLLEPKK